jgi:hypothetical protein
MSDNVSDATRITTGKMGFESRLAIRRSHIYDRHHHTVDPVGHGGPYTGGAAEPATLVCGIRCPTGATPVLTMYLL